MSGRGPADGDWDDESVSPSTDPVTAAQALADERLLADAPEVDAADSLPPSHLAALDATGLTGLAASDADVPTRFAVAEALAGGCLATAFVWQQHQGALAFVLRAAGPATAPVPDLAAGRLRGGVAITALRGATPLRLSPDGTLTGRVPWVTGWSLLDVLVVAALDEHDDVALLLLDRPTGPTASARPLHLTAARASTTVELTLAGHPVSDGRQLGTVPQDEWWARDAAGLGGNGALALGVAARAARLADSDQLIRAVDGARDRLLGAAVPDLPAARAACSALAIRAAAALAVLEGARGVIAGSHPERLVREAHFLSVFGSRPAIRAALLTEFAVT